MNNKKKILIFFLLFISIINGKFIEKKTGFVFKSSFNGCYVTNSGYYKKFFPLCSTAFYDCNKKLVVQTKIYSSLLSKNGYFGFGYAVVINYVLNHNKDTDENDKKNINDFMKNFGLLEYGDVITAIYDYKSSKSEITLGRNKKVKIMYAGKIEKDKIIKYKTLLLKSLIK